MTLLLLSALAFADAIDPEPSDCPPGSRGTSSHAGAWCAAGTCPAACPDGTTCEKAGLCVLTEEIDCGGWRSGDTDCRVKKEEALGACSSQADCAKGTCEVVDRCVPMAPKPAAVLMSPAESLGCGCAVGPSPGAAATLGATLLLALGAMRRRDAR